VELQLQASARPPIGFAADCGSDYRVSQQCRPPPTTQLFIDCNLPLTLLRYFS